MNTHLARAYLRHFITARNSHALHSPFLFLLYNEAIKNRKTLEALPIERLRKQLLNDERELEALNLGAGSKAGITHRPTVKKLAATVAVRPQYGALLLRLVHFLKAQNILELGTSLGLGTAFLASHSEARVTSIDGCSETQKVARDNLSKLGFMDRVELLTGTFDDVLPGLLAERRTWDLIYIDGDHRKTSTLRYFEQIIPHLHENSMVIFDDIYWSKGMTEAWKSIQEHPAVRQTIDVFQFGMVFFHTNQLNEHFRLRL